MSKSLTELIYKFIVRYQQGHGGCPPTYKQIGEFAGISHKGPVYHHMSKLRSQGKISTDDSGRSYAVGGIWLSPEDIEALTVAYRTDRVLKYPGDDGGFWMTLWKIVGQPHTEGLTSWTVKEPPIVRGDSLDAVEEEVFPPTRY